MIATAWNNLWSNLTQNKLRTIKSKPSPWSTSNRNFRHEEVILSLLRIGHTRLAHAYLPLNLHLPSCNYCLSENLTVHSLFTCPTLLNLRTQLNVPHFVSSALCNNSETVSRSINYLRSAAYFYFLHELLFPQLTVELMTHMCCRIARKYRKKYLLVAHVQCVFR